MVGLGVGTLIRIIIGRTGPVRNRDVRARQCDGRRVAN
jgi:hypothetical protein